jgi:hypothetical protein
MDNHCLSTKNKYEKIKNNVDVSPPKWNTYIYYIASRVSHAVPRCIAYSECEKEKGLLEGIPDVGNAKDYSRKLNLKDASNSLEN